MKNHTVNGITLVELLAVISILTGITLLSAPSFAAQLDKLSLRSSAHQLYSTLQYARVEAIRSAKVVTVNFGKVGTAWCVGLNNAQPPAKCDCFAQDSCVIDEKRNNSLVDDGKHVRLSEANFAGGDEFLAFSPERGIASAAGASRNGTIWLRSRMNRQMAIVVSRLGRIRTCEAGESGCPSPPAI